MKKIFFILSTLILIASKNICNAQEILSESDAKLLTTIPFKQLSGGVMLIRAKYGNIPDSLNFVLDTGSGGISLDSSTCAAYNIKSVQTDTSITGIAGVHKVRFVFDETLYFKHLTIAHLNFHLSDYDVLSSVYGEKIDGIIGYSFFSRYIVTINFDSNLVKVYSPGKISYPKQGTLLHPVFTTLPIQWVKIKEKKNVGFNYYFDTGAGLCILLSETFAKDSNILLSRRKPVVSQVEGLGGKKQMRLTLIKEVKIGPYRFRRVPTYLYDDQFNVTSFPFTGGLIGIDLLRRFNLTVNYPKREIYLEPNTHFLDNFDYAYTGLSIYYVNGKIIVEDVIPNSPGDKARFLSGDEIIAVGNNLTGNIVAYKNLLQVPKQQIKVIVKRKEQFITLILFTQSIK